MHDHPTDGFHTHGDTIHWARGYDWLLRIVTLGGEGRFRRRTIEAAGIREGDRVLDVGCGTGTLAIEAARAAGGGGSVTGIDPAEEMVLRAKSKAKSAAVTATFQQAAIEALPFPDEQFDVVTSTLMFHHLPVPLQKRGLEEVNRVLRPGGRLCIVDFQPGDSSLHRIASHIASHRHGDQEARVGLIEVAEMVRELGMDPVELERFRPRIFQCLRAVKRADG